MENQNTSNQSDQEKAGQNNQPNRVNQSNQTYNPDQANERPGGFQFTEKGKNVYTKQRQENDQSPIPGRPRSKSAGKKQTSAQTPAKSRFQADQSDQRPAADRASHQQSNYPNVDGNDNNTPTKSTADIGKNNPGQTVKYSSPSNTNTPQAKSTNVQEKDMGVSHAEEKTGSYQSLDATNTDNTESKISVGKQYASNPNRTDPKGGDYSQNINVEENLQSNGEDVDDEKPKTDLSQGSEFRQDAANQNSDQDMVGRIEKSLQQQFGPVIARVTVTLQSDVVVLEGEVNSEQDKKNIEEAVITFVTEDRVDNQLQVRGKETTV